jgi:hypothetical protein
MNQYKQNRSQNQ